MRTLALAAALLAATAGGAGAASGFPSGTFAATLSGKSPRSSTARGG